MAYKDKTEFDTILYFFPSDDTDVVFKITCILLIKFERLRTAFLDICMYALYGAVFVTPCQYVPGPFHVALFI